MLEILVGPIASGKSTYCRKKTIEGALVVNDDMIVNSIHAGMNFLYKKELKPLYKTIENLIIYWGISNNKTVIVDRPNHNIETRKRYIGLAKSLDCKVICTIFPREAPEIHAKRRFESDPRGFDLEHWLEAAKRHEEKYVHPTIEEGFDDLIFFQKET